MHCPDEVLMGFQSYAVDRFLLFYGHSHLHIHAYLHTWILAYIYYVGILCYHLSLIKLFFDLTKLFCYPPFKSRNLFLYGSLIVSNQSSSLSILCIIHILHLINLMYNLFSTKNKESKQTSLI